MSVASFCRLWSAGDAICDAGHVSSPAAATSLRRRTRERRPRPCRGAATAWRPAGTFHTRHSRDNEARDPGTPAAVDEIRLREREGWPEQEPVQTEPGALRVEEARTVLRVEVALVHVFVERLPRLVQQQSWRPDRLCRRARPSRECVDTRTGHARCGRSGVAATRRTASVRAHGRAGVATSRRSPTGEAATSTSSAASSSETRSSGSRSSTHSCCARRSRCSC